MTKFLATNWKKSYLSLAVWLPVITYTGNAFVEAVVKEQFIPAPYVPVVLLVTGLIGKAIKQRSLSGDL